MKSWNERWCWCIRKICQEKSILWQKWTRFFTVCWMPAKQVCSEIKRASSKKNKSEINTYKNTIFWQIKLTFFAKSFEIVYVNFVTWCNYFYFLIEVNILHTVKNIKMFHCFAEISSFYSPSFRLRVQYQTQPTWVKRLFKLKYKKLLNVHLTDLFVWCDHLKTTLIGRIFTCRDLLVF